MRFHMYGKEYKLTPEDVEASLRRCTPEPIQQLAVNVLDQWWPVKQAYGAVMGKGNSEFNSRRAFDIFRRIGLPVHDSRHDGALPRRAAESRSSHAIETRTLSLSLAVTLAAGTSRRAGDVIAEAEAFERWLRS